MKYDFYVVKGSLWIIFFTLGKIWNNNSGVFDIMSDNIETFTRVVLSRPVAMELIWEYKDIVFADRTKNTI